MLAINSQLGTFTIRSERDERNLTYIVECENGHHQLVHEQDLVDGLVCQRCNPRKKHRRGYKCGDVPEAYFNSLRRGADSRKIEFDISIEDVDEAFRRQGGCCALSGLKLYFKLKSEPGTASVDRKDSRLGYSPGNIQIVHKAVNRLKGALSDEKFIWFCKQVAEFNA